MSRSDMFDVLEELAADVRAEEALRRKDEALIGAAKLVRAIGEWFIREEPEVPKWFEDAVLEIEATTRAALAAVPEEKQG